MKRRNHNKILKQKRQDSAIVRQAAHEVLTTTQKLQKLDDKLGVGKGATKERTRLVKLLKGEKS